MLKILFLMLALPSAQLVFANIPEDNGGVAANALVIDNMPQSGVWIPDGDYIESCLPQSTGDGNPYCVRNHVSDYRRCVVTIASAEGHIALRCGNAS